MKKYSRFLLAVLLLLSVTIWACQPEETPPPAKPVVKQKLASPAQFEKAPVVEKDFRTIIINVAKENIPSVVHIQVTQQQEVVNPFSPFENNPFFRRFFDSPQTPRKFKRELKGIGTGMIIDEGGHILTNNHVVAGATQIEVILSNESRYQATVIGTDPKTDLAIIKVAATEKLPHVTFGDSDKVEVGEWVVAIGHPRGLDQTVTQGIISAKHRRGITDPTSYEDFLQTDAAINPGNSGGPLLNLDGQVIGVNSVIISQSGGYEGIGFAIPSNMALYIAKALMDSGKVERGWLGVSLQDVPFDKLKALKLETTKGAYVVEVVKGGPASRAGVKADDVILTMDGKDIEDSSTFRNLIAATSIGKEVTFGILRDGVMLSLTVKIGAPEDAVKAMTVSMKERLGVDVRPISENEIQKYGMDQGQGIAIKWLEPSGPMAKAGFEIDDLVMRVNNQPIDGVENFASLASALEPGKEAVMLVIDHRTGRSGYIKVEVR
ncbi:MAG: Do family serine endopeptidase [Deltaproteobacteria bacterium]|nr:Do family serine endopeptidase [Deltaproteobacteria bacterium]